MRTLIILICSITISTAAQSQKITGILGAFPDEITYLLTQVQQPKDTVIQQTHFTKGLLNGKQVVVAQTGIGKVNAAITTTLLIEHFHPHEILFTGIAGAINANLQPGDLVIGTKLTYHDYGAITGADITVNRPTKNPYTLKENPLYFNCDSSLVALAQRVGNNISLEKINRNNQLQSPTIISGTIVTGDVFVNSDKAAKRLQNDLHADATEMEGAAVAQVCHQQHIPFIVIRSMSDKANSNAHTDVATFYKIAAHNSATFVIDMVSKL